ncbi:MAG: 50S ribosomal protein L6 [Candidatus Brocadiaceae bacterium]|nr:50S ribosomal protein L6 [Candidatus Brocadiaceae bacterium]
MSRTGNKEIEVPRGVQVTVDGPRVSVKGPLGELSHELPDRLELDYRPETGRLVVRRRDESRQARALHGLHRSLLANMVEGVARGFSCVLEIHGTGYNVNVRGGSLVLQIGFCHEVVFDLPSGITVEVEQSAAQAGRPARFAVKGPDKHAVKQFAATVRAVRPPEPYKGKGIRYDGEYVRRKEGKAFAGLDR